MAASPQLVEESQRAPARVHPTHLEDNCLERRAELVGTGAGTVRALGESLETSFLIALHPPIDALAGDADGGCDFADGEAVSNDGKYRVVTLFHLGELHEHSATSSAPSRAEDGGARLSSINRYCVTDQALQSH
jgi:hypothetical protein